MNLTKKKQTHRCRVQNTGLFFYMCLDWGYLMVAPRITWVDEYGSEMRSLATFSTCILQPSLFPHPPPHCAKGNVKWLLNVMQYFVLPGHTVCALKTMGLFLHDHALFHCPCFPRMPRHFWNLWRITCLVLLLQQSPGLTLASGSWQRHLPISKQVSMLLLDVVLIAVLQLLANACWRC